MTRSITASALAVLVSLAAALPATASATDDVRAAMMKFAGLNSFRMTMDKGGTMDFVRPNSMHMSASGMEMYAIGSTMYMRRGAQGWMKIQNRGNGPADVGDWTRMTREKANDVTATDLGMRSVGGETYHAYRTTSKGKDSSTVYVGRDGFVHRVDSGGLGHGVTFSNFNGIAPFRAPI